MAFTRNISLSDKIQVVTGLNNAAVANTTTVYGTVIDTQGYQSCCLVMTSAAAAVANTPVLSCGYGINTTTNTLITGSAVPTGLNTTCQILDIVRPSQRYLFPKVASPSTATANSTVTVIAILSGREPPVTTVINSSQTFNTTTALFTGTQNVTSSTNTPISINLVSNP